MREFHGGSYDVAVIGAGHAGIEAALAAARMGMETICLTVSLDAVGNMPCNPAIGGTGKGHLVRELDALGGEMARAADKACIQYRMLNLGKGPAVHSLRAQIDRNKYARVMKHKLEQCENLVMRQAEVIDIERDGENWLLTTRLGAVYTCRAVVLATGTFLGGRIFVGEVSYAGGPDGMFPATELAGSLKELGISLRRFKTGTPARVLRSSIDFTDLEVQKGDEPVTPFSFDAEMPPKNSAVCYVSWTNDRTKQVILDNIHRSPLYAGMIEGVGPRYCPSIEDKIMRFSEKPRRAVRGRLVAAGLVCRRQVAGLFREAVVAQLGQGKAAARRGGQSARQRHAGRCAVHPHQPCRLCRKGQDIQYQFVCLFHHAATSFFCISFSFQYTANRG